MSEAMGRKMTSMRGQLGTRSSALSPTSSKLTTQYLVLDHMNNHYKKIVSAKSAIDNKPPKSLKTSQKVRDKNRRDHAQTGSRPNSRASVRPRSQMHNIDEDDLYNDRLWEEFDPEDEDDLLVRDIVKSTLKQRGQGSAIATYGSGSQLNQRDAMENTMVYPSCPDNARRQDNRPSSARSSRSIYSARGQSRHVAVTIPAHTDKTYDGDVLMKNAHVFTEPEKPFTPRLLKSTRSSKLSQYKYYTPPKKEKGKKAEKTNKETKEASLPSKDVKHAPVPKPRMKTLENKTREHSPDLWDTTLMMETLQSRDFSKFEQKDLVPRLDISLDQDHMNWLQDQASKAQHRAKSGGLKTTDEFTGLGNTLESTNNSKLRSYREMELPRSSRMTDEEEELKYLKFVKDVTNDVLNRGIYTNRVLQQIFEGHIQSNKGQLKETKMRLMLNQVRRDLGIPKENISLEGTERFMTGGTMKSTKKAPGATVAQTSQLSTLNSQDTYDFQSTGAMFSTIHSNVNEKMSDTQALQKYQLDISKREEADEEVNVNGGIYKEHEVDEGYEVVRIDSSPDQPATKVGPQKSTEGSTMNTQDNRSVELVEVHKEKDNRTNETPVTGESEEEYTGQTQINQSAPNRKVAGEDETHNNEVRNERQEDIPLTEQEMLGVKVLPPKPKPRLLKTDAISEEMPPKLKQQESEEKSNSTIDQSEHADEYDDYEDDYEASGDEDDDEDNTLTDDDF